MRRFSLVFILFFLLSASAYSQTLLYGWGDNEHGQLGDGSTTYRYSPVQIGTGTEWKSVTCGGFHTIAIKTDGTLWAWGDNDHGQLGDGSTTARHSPVQIGTGTEWKSAACGAFHTIAIKTDGTLWAWGDNDHGQLGDGSTTARHSPVQIGTRTDWISVNCCEYHTVAIKTDGTLWAWGNNDYGQLGDGSTTTRLSPVQIGSGIDWKSISCGSIHTIAIKIDGTLWAWGNNDYGQLGDGSTTDRHSPVQIGSGTDWNSAACGLYHTIAIKSDGTLWAWGWNYYGQLGDGTTTDRYSPVQIGSGTDWNSAACGLYHTIAIKSDGTLWAWGWNYYGQLGDGTTTDRYSPIQIGSENDGVSISCGCLYTVAIMKLREIPTLETQPISGITVNSAYSGGNIISEGVAAITARGVCWNTTGNPTISDSHSDDGTGTGSFTSHITGLSPNTTYYVRAYATNSAGTAYGTEDDFQTLSSEYIRNSLYGWGSNSNGQLGDGSTTDRYSPVQIGSETNWKSVACGFDYTIAIKIDGTLWAWGYNSKGQLGDGSTTERYSPVQIGSETNWKSVACGGFHTIAIKTDGTLWAWGLNYYGQLGDGSSTDRHIPVQIGSENDWKSVACGIYHTIAIKTNRTLWTWGENFDGRLGDGSTTDRHSPVQVGSETDWKSVACGGFHTIAIKRNGTLWAWGDNDYGQLGDGSTTDSCLPVQIGTGTDWKSAAGGFYYTIAIKTDGTLWAWGDNIVGQLGDGSTTDRYSPVQIGTGTDWNTAACGLYHTIAIKTDGTLWAWGYNIVGQLGDESTTDRYSPVQIGTGTDWVSASCGADFSMALMNTIVIPTIATQIISDITDNSANSGGGITSNGGAGITARGVCWNTTGTPTISDSHTNDGTGTGLFTSHITGLSPNTTYYVRAYATNCAGTAYGEEFDFMTLSTEPSNHSIAFNAESGGTNQINLSFHAAEETENCAGYIVLRKTGSTPPDATGVTDGVAPTSLSMPLGTTLIDVVDNITVVDLSNTGLTPNTQYSYALIPFNWDGLNPETYNYLTDPVIPSATARTNQVPSIGMPTNYPADFRISDVNKKTITLSWTDAVGEILPERYLIIGSSNGFDNLPVPVDGQAVESDNFNNIIVKTVDQGTQTVTFRNLESDLKYSFRIYPFTGTCENRKYKTDEITPAAATYLVPFVQACRLSTSQITQTGMTVGFESGSGQGRLLIAKTSSISIEPIAQRTAYTADPSFTGSGSVVDGNGKVLYIGSGNTVDITDLTLGTTYYFKVLEYNGSGSETIYNMGNARGNPKSFTTMNRGITFEVLGNGIGYGNIEVSAIYPNPARDEVNLNISINDVMTFDVRIYDINGNIIDKCCKTGLKFYPGDHRIQFDTHELISGTYIMELNSGNEMIYSKVEIIR